MKPWNTSPICLDIFPKNKLARKYFELISDRLKLEGEKKVEEISPHYLYYMIKVERADNHIKNGNYLKAKQILEEILILFPHNEIAKEKLIVCAFKLDPKEFDSLIPGFYSQATNLFVTGNQERAERQFKFLNQLRPNYLDIKDYLKKITAEKKTKEKKKKEIQVKKQSPKYDLKNKLSKANSLFRKKKFKDSLKIYNEVLQQFPDDYTANLYSSKILNEIEGKKQIQKIVRFTRTTSNRKRAENLYLKRTVFLPNPRL